VEYRAQRERRARRAAPLTRVAVPPPPTLQLHGRAEILDWWDKGGIAVFDRFWIGRRILHAYAASRKRGDTRVCFLKITLEPTVRAYMVGTSIWDLTRDMEARAATVRIA
jgi:hypothetical protein